MYLSQVSGSQGLRKPFSGNEIKETNLSNVSVKNSSSKDFPAKRSPSSKDFLWSDIFLCFDVA